MAEPKPPLTAAQHDLAARHVELARRVAGIMARRLTGQMDRETVLSAAYEGLIEAARRFDPGRGLEFGTMASHRIRGMILDEARRGRLFGPTARSKARRLAALSLDANPGADPDRRSATLAAVLADDGPPVGRDLEAREWIEAACARLPDGQRALMLAYYRDGLNGAEVARNAGVSESWVGLVRRNFEAELRREAARTGHVCGVRPPRWWRGGSASGDDAT